MWPRTSASRSRYRRDPVKKFARQGQASRTASKKQRSTSCCRITTSNISPHHTSGWSRRSRASPRSAFLSFLMLRSAQTGALRNGERGPLRARGPKTYTHFTSPIRRYPDLVGAPAAARCARGRATPDENELNPIADECSQSERRAADAERELVEWKKVKFMSDASARTSMADSSPLRSTASSSS